jgi:hypothetical protein
MVIRGPGGVGRQLGAEHSQRLESYFQSIPGVQLVAVSTVANAKALLKSVGGPASGSCFFGGGARAAGKRGGRGLTAPSPPLLLFPSQPAGHPQRQPRHLL